MLKYRKNFKSGTRSAERGSILFYLLICVALFGTLYYAVAQMLRGGGNAPLTENMTMTADGILQYSNTIRAAVQAMTINGVDPAAICFDSPNWGAATYSFAACATPANKVFDLNGGGVSWEANSADATAASSWLFTGANGVASVGTTCASASCADLKMILPDVTKAQCLAINTQLGVANPSGNPPVDTGYDATPFTGTYAVSATGDLGDEAGSAALSGQAAGCFLNAGGSNAGHYTFYRVLIAR